MSMTLNTKSRRNFDSVATAAQAKGILYAKSGFLVYESFDNPPFVNLF